ncbi:MAG: TolC family protein [Gallionellaceae bacterium]|jgi:outer membrane protein TolC
MGKPYRILICLFCWSSISAGAAEPVGAAVEELLALAKAQNPQLATMRYEAEAAAQRVESSSALPDPSFRMSLQDFTNKESGGTTTLVPSQVGSTYYRVMQPLPFWGKRGLKQQIAEAEASSARGRTGTTWAELSAKIKSDFAQYYLVVHSHKLTQEILDLTQNLERIAKSRYATGLAPQQDVIRAQVEQTGLRRDLVMLETEHHHSIAKLNTALLREPFAALAEPQRLRALPAPAKLEFGLLAERLRAQSPQLLSVEAQVSAADKNRDLVLKNRYPDVALGVGATQVGNDIRMWELMLEFNIPLQQGSRRGQERDAESMLAAARSRKEAAASQLLGELAEYTSALQAARRLESISANSLIPQAEATLQAAYVGYQNGKVDFATLLDAQRQILKAKLDVLIAQAQAQTSLAQIEKLLGEEL